MCMSMWRKGPPLHITPLLLVHIVLHQPSHPGTLHTPAHNTLCVCVCAGSFLFCVRALPRLSLLWCPPPPVPIWRTGESPSFPLLHRLFKGRRDRLRRCHGYSRGRVKKNRRVLQTIYFGFHHRFFKKRSRSIDLFAREGEKSKFLSRLPPFPRF